MTTGGGSINISYMDNYKGHFMGKKKELDSKIQNEEKNSPGINRASK